MKNLIRLFALAAPAVFAVAPALAQSVTGPPTNLTPGSYTPDVYGRISLDGSKIAYTAQKGNWDLSYTYDNQYAMDPDGSDKYRLEIWAYFGGSEQWGSMSPDGSTMVLRQTGRGDAAQNGLFKATVDPFKPTQLNNNVLDTMPVYSSDGTKIAFLRKPGGIDTEPYQVFMMKPEKEDFSTNNPVQLTNWFDGEPVQINGTADNKLFVVKKISDTVQEIYRVDFSDSQFPGGGQGNNLTQLTSFGKVVSWPSQATPGGPVYFLMKAKDGRNHVFSMNPDGTGVHQVTGGTYNEDMPSAGGNKLVVTITDPVNGSGNQDIAIYTLSQDTTPGTMSGTFTSMKGEPQAGTTVNAYDGDTLKATATTDANGQYSLSLPPGGYTLEYVTTSPNSYTVTRSVAVPAGGAVSQDAFTTPTSAPRPSGLVATVKDGKAALRWTKGNNPDGGYNLVGYNAYRAPAEIGPWTKVNAAPIPPTAPLQYVDANPGNLSAAFYKMSAVTTDGTTTRESAFTDIAQAANNLVYNPSFEMVDANGQPLGWEYTQWGGDGSGGTTTTLATHGSRSAYLKTGDTARAGQMFHTIQAFETPVQPGVPIVEGMFGKFKDTTTTWPLALQTALRVPGWIYWYPGGGGLGGPWDTPGLKNGGGDTEWIWQANIGPIYPFENSTTTRLSVFWANDGLTTLGSSTAYADDVTYQVKRFGDTGMVFGRIVDGDGNGMAGITVSVGDKSIVTNGSDVFIIPDAPSGEQTLTIAVPNQAPHTQTIGNYGGYRLVEPYVVANPGPFTISGKVLLPNGKPAAGADVRLVQTDDGGAQVQFWTTTTDASGFYTFGDDINVVATPNTSIVVASKKGYISPWLEKKFGSAGWSVNNDLTLVQPDAVVEIAKTTAPPTIDGTLNTSEWAASQKIPFTFTNSSMATPLHNEAYALWDNDNVYFGFMAEEPNPAGIFSDPNVAMWGTPPYWNGHDMFELRIDPTNGAATGLGYEWWQIMSNTGSPVFNYNVLWRRRAHSIWGGDTPIPGMQVVSRVDTAGKKWYQEVKIPFSGLSSPYGMFVSTPNVGDEWAMSFARQRHQPDPVGEQYAVNRFLTDVGAIARFVNAVSPLPKGDLNGDRVVNMNDVEISFRIASGAEALGGRLAQGDVNSDNKCDLSDTAKIIRKVNGLDNF